MAGASRTAAVSARVREESVSDEQVREQKPVAKQYAFVSEYPPELHDHYAGDKGLEKPQKKSKKTSTGGKGSRKLQKLANQLAGIQRLPMELIIRIFAYLDAQDLMALSRANKDLRYISSLRALCILHYKSHNRAIVMDKNHGPAMWKTACQNIRGFPASFPDLTLPQFSGLLFDEACHVCGEKCKDIDFMLRVRCCSQCAPANIIHNPLTPGSLEHKLVRIGHWVRGRGFPWQHLPKQTRYNTPFVFRPALMKARELITAYGGPANAFLNKEIQKLAAIGDYVAARQDRYHAAGLAWIEQRIENAKQTEQEAGQRRLRDIKIRLTDLGYEIDKLSSEIWDHKTVAQPRDLTDAIWKRIQQPLLEEIKQLQIKQRRSGIVQRLSKMLIDVKTPTTFTENTFIYPLAPDLLDKSPAQGGIGDGGTEMPTEEDWQALSAILPELVRRFQATVTQDLLALLPLAVIDQKGSVDVLQRATTLFLDRQALWMDPQPVKDIFKHRLNKYEASQYIFASDHYTAGSTLLQVAGLNCGDVSHAQALQLKECFRFDEKQNMVPESWQGLVSFDAAIKQPMVVNACIDIKYLTAKDIQAYKATAQAQAQAGAAARAAHALATQRARPPPPVFQYRPGEYNRASVVANLNEQLIKTVNKLQDAFASVGLSSSSLDLPQIAVIGSQSSGKSSVLENIVGRDFLPRGTGIVTRRPLVLQLINRPSSKPQPTSVAEPNGSSEEVKVNGSDEGKNEDEWGEFLHKPGEKFYDFNKIRDEIVADTEAKTGKNAGISPLPINLRIFSPRVLTLTLVDLPGLTKVPVGDQPKDIERQIREMLLKFITRPNSIILAVTAANTDLANSDGLKMAREVDPEGSRTIGVLTKVDLMDQGTDVVDILAGRIIPLRLGYVPVVNRGQRDIESKKAISLALDKERDFFENHAAYKSKSQYCGTPFLARKLNLILMHHIRATLPDIKQKIAQSLLKYQTELTSLGGAMGEGSGGNVILQIITEFCTDFRTAIDGNSQDLSLNELSGGARISFVFHELFSNGVKAIDPQDQVKDVDIRTILYNSSGSSPALFVGTTAFEVIIKQQIKRLEEPSLKCANLVYDELVRILTQLLNKHQSFKRYPALKERFYSVVIAFYKRAMSPTNKLVTDLVSAESCYINTGHPDFISGHKAMAIVNNRIEASKPAPAAVDPKGKILPPGAVNNNKDLDVNLKQEEQGFFGSFWQNPKGQVANKKRISAMEAPPQVLKASGQLSDREHMETEVIKLLIASYFNITKRTIIDMVPKAIMLNLVQHSKEDLQRELLAELYKPEVMDELLKESDFVVNRRRECIKMVQALTKADEIVSTV